MFLNQRDFWQQVQKVLNEGTIRKAYCRDRASHPPRSRATRSILVSLIVSGIGTLFALSVLDFTIARIARSERFRPSDSIVESGLSQPNARSQSADSIPENGLSQLTLDEVSLLQQLSTVPELHFVDDDQIREAKRGVRFTGRSANGRRGEKGEEPFVSEINRHACNRAEKAGLSIKWEFMDKSDRDSMVSLSSEMRRHNLVGVDRTNGRATSQAEVVSALSGHLARRITSSFLPTMVQVLQVEPGPSRLVLIEKLDYFRNERPTLRRATTKALAARALFDNSMAVREAALRALENSDKSFFLPLLVEGLDYPWAPVVWRAAYALRKLGMQQVVPELKKIVVNTGRNANTMRELVRVSHLQNCLFCHRPSFDGSGARVPISGEPLSPNDSSRKSRAQNGYGSVNPNELAVDPGATCLHQDFSVILPVSNCGSWPDRQRFDFTTRVRPVTEEDDRRLHEIHRVRMMAANYALEEISAREGKPFVLRTEGR
jgi:hypothetical protein